MATAEQILAVAAGEIGYSRWDDPEEGTRYGRWYATRHGAWYGTSGVAYCCMFVTWCLAQGGARLPGGDFAYVPAAVDAARAAGRLVSTDECHPGDALAFDWDGDGVADHIGFAEAPHNAWVQTIEGNTSLGDTGSQSDGGVVARRARDWDDVCAVIRPVYDDADDQERQIPDSQAHRTGYGAIAVDGVFGPESWSRFRRVMGAWYPAPWSDAVAALQRFLNADVAPGHIRDLTGDDALVVDGDWGWRTTIVLQFWMWNRLPRTNPVWQRYCPGWTMSDFCDGIDGTATDAVLQAVLNESWGDSGKLLGR